MFLILLPLHFVCLADIVFPAVGTLLQLGRATENKMALITDKIILITCVIIAETKLMHKTGRCLSISDLEKSSLSQAASTAHTIHGAIKTGKAISATAKGAAVGRPYGATALGDVRFTDAPQRLSTSISWTNAGPISPTAQTISAATTAAPPPCLL